MRRMRRDERLELADSRIALAGDQARRPEQVLRVGRELVLGVLRPERREQRQRFGVLLLFDQRLGQIEGGRSGLRVLGPVREEIAEGLDRALRPPQLEVAQAQAEEGFGREGRRRVFPDHVVVGGARRRVLLQSIERLGFPETSFELPAQQLEGRFWEAEALYRLKQYAAARSAYDDVIGKDATSPLAPEALFGLGLSDLELRRPEGAIKAFRDLLTNWPEHAQAGSATFYLAQTLVEQKKYSEALPLLTTFGTKYPKHKLAPDAQYLLGSTRLVAGERDAGVSELQAFVAAHPTHQMVPAARRAITDSLAKSGSPTQQKTAYTQLMQPSATAESLYDAGVIAGKAGQVKDQQVAWG